MRRPGGHPLLARIIDPVMRPLHRVRAKVVPRVRGRVLEIGMGTALNLEHYDPEGVVELVGIEPDPHMRARAERRLPEAAFPTSLVATGAETLPFDDGSFDEVLVTFTLCTVADVPRALAEIRRVLAPGGKLHFAEHTRSDTPWTAWVQRTVDPLYTRLAGGCHLDRDAVGLIEAAGFCVEELHDHGRTPFNPTPIHRGVARRPDT